jgi:hypothetical protein
MAHRFFVFVLAATLEQPIGRPVGPPLELRGVGHFVDLVVEEWV